MSRICVHFMKGFCRYGSKCKDIHDKGICRNYFFNGDCKRGDSCKFSHTVTMDNQNKPNTKNKGRRVKNTENFEPSHSPPEMRIVLGSPGLTVYNRKHSSRDVVVVNSLFGSVDNTDIYKSLLEEINQSGVNLEKLWKSWHGDSHWIADDKLNWKEKCPTFKMVLDKIQKYFDMDIKATRFNLYKDSSEWKPFHHDAAAVKSDKAKTQNATVAVSFGAERDAAFEHAKTKTIISLPQPNGTIYTFGRDVNIMWKHGIPQVSEKNYNENGRISIIAWGWIDQFDL